MRSRPGGRDEDDEDDEDDDRAFFAAVSWVVGGARTDRGAGRDDDDFLRTAMAGS